MSIRIDLGGIALEPLPQKALWWPAEATLLCHPAARRLWRARYAEGRLLAYDTEAVLTDWRPAPLAPRLEAIRALVPVSERHGRSSIDVRAERQ